MIRANLPTIFTILALMFGGVWSIMSWSYGSIAAGGGRASPERQRKINTRNVDASRISMAQIL
ncbi:hypothetical protein [Bradyrhizobium sp. McL0615]|uniref:hypothetical protein n=1 Tax=Bradyrhizobium sp. McL0615 TaxID=3415673 RepID=UPI003CEDE0A9